MKAAKLGYAIRADRWGKGYATDASRRMIEFGFKDLGLHRVSAAIGPNNAASVAVVRKLGMHYEGRIRDHVFTNGAWRDSLLFSVLEQEWSALGRDRGSATDGSRFAPTTDSSQRRSTSLEAPPPQLAVDRDVPL